MGGRILGFGIFDKVHLSQFLIQLSTSEYILFELMSGGHIILLSAIFVVLLLQKCSFVNFKYGAGEISAAGIHLECW